MNSHSAQTFVPRAASAAPRALVVDDSRSARVILSRMLEAHGLRVDAAETAEQALEYVRSTRPDAIFMDHLMPGMDGLEAVRALKGDARTRDIPVMMYTSQDSEEYLQRALLDGAAGVLSKTLAQTDVARALYQLGLLVDRRESPLESAPPRAASVEDVRHEAPREAQREAPAASRPAPRGDEWQAALRAEFEILRRRLLAAAPAQAASAAPILERSNERQGFWGAVGIALSVALIAICALLWRDVRMLDARLSQIDKQLTQALRPPQRALDGPRAAAQLSAVATWLAPYGEPVFNAARVAQLRERLQTWQAAGFSGEARVVSYVGDFCLAGSAGAGYTPVSAGSPMRRCDVVGNPFEDALGEGPRQSPELSTLLTGLERDARFPLRISVAFGGRQPVEPYPPRTPELNAAEWNQVAARNNRIELFLSPASPQ